MDGVIIDIDASEEFRGMFDRNAVSGAIKGKLSADRKSVQEVTCDHTFRVDIREEHWTVSLEDLPIEPSPSDPSLLAAYIEGTDASCRLIPLEGSTGRPLSTETGYGSQPERPFVLRSNDGEVIVFTAS